jgi:hypothetical protein
MSLARWKAWYFSCNKGTQHSAVGLRHIGIIRLMPWANTNLLNSFERVSCCQRNGFRNREMWHHVDYEEARKHPEKLGEMTGRWITQHDPEQYVYDNWEKCVNALVSGSKFKNTNIPPGYTYKPWTIDELLNTDGGNTGKDEGDWS